MANLLGSLFKKKPSKKEVAEKNRQELRIRLEIVLKRDQTEDSQTILIDDEKSITEIKEQLGIRWIFSEVAVTKEDEGGEE